MRSGNAGVGTVMRVRVRLLGQIDVVMDGTARLVQGLRRNAVLAALALHPDQVVGTDRLIEIVWDGRPPANALNTLQSHVSHLRRVLGAGSLLTQAPGYLFSTGGGQLTDVQLAEDLIQTGTRSPDPVHAADRLAAAVGLWRGRPLAQLGDLGWFGDQARRLEQLQLQARHALINARLALGEHFELLAELRELAAEHPLHEHLHGQYMLALYRAGRQGEALAAYQTVRRTLDAELAVPPCRQLRDLHASILRQDPALDLPPPRPDADRNDAVRGDAARGDAARAGAVRDDPGRAAVEQAPVRGIRFGGRAVTGRGPQLAALRDLVGAAAEGTGRAVFLVGEAGIGKTRLAVETARVAHDAGLRVLRGRAGRGGAHFRPLSEALLSQLRWSAPPVDADLAPYLPALSRLVPEWRTRGPVEVDDDSLVVLAEAVLRLLSSLGRPGGCLVVLEDLHDADADTLAVVDYLIDNIRDEPVLLLGTVRVEPSAARELVHAAGYRRAADVLELARLDDGGVRRLVAGCLDTTPELVPVPVLERLLALADGIPLHVEELLAGMVSDGVLARADGHWVLRGPLPSQIPTPLAATLAGRVARLSAPAQDLLRAAALLGRHFPVSVAADAAGATGPAFLPYLHEAVNAALLVPGDAPALYAFRHALTAEALRAQMLPLELAALSRRTAEAVEAAAATLPGAWRETAAELWYTAGETRRAAVLFGEAGRLAATEGAVSTGVALLERAMSIMDGDSSDRLAADLGAALVDAYAVAGRIADAYGIGARLHGHTEAGRQAAIHLRLARVASLAGHWERGLREVDAMRRLLGSRLERAIGAQLDAVEARLVFGNPTPDRRAAAERLAWRALRAAENTGQPDVACRALEVLGRCARLTDLATADALCEQGLLIAEANNLVSRRVSLLYQIGANDGIRAADTRRLARALEVANDAGAVVTALDIELEMAVVQICRGEYAEAEAAVLRCEQTAARLRLSHTRLIALGERVMVAAHRGHGAEVERLLTAFRDLGGEDEDFGTAVRGFGLVFHHLLAGDRSGALAQAQAAVAQEARRPTSYLSLIHGPHLLLRVVGDAAGEVECAELGRSAQAQAAWNHQYLVLSQAVVHGRAGRVAEADEAVRQFTKASQAYPLARRLGFGLVAAEAREHGWGDPVSWSRGDARH